MESELSKMKEDTIFYHQEGERIKTLYTVSKNIKLFEVKAVKDSGYEGATKVEEINLNGIKALYYDDTLTFDRNNVQIDFFVKALQKTNL